MKWPQVALEKVAKITGGSTPSRNRDELWGGEIRWATPTDLPMPGQSIAYIIDTADHITEEGLQSCSANLLPVGSVIFSTRATIGKIGIAKVPLATNQGFANFTPKPFLDSKYLAYVFQKYTQKISLLAGSTTFKEVSRGAIKKFKIPLPPISEQRRIVEILDQADQLRKLRADGDVKAQRILPALFIKMFGDPATNPMGWDTVPLDKVVDIGTQLVNPNQPDFLDLLHIGGEQIEKDTGRILSPILVRKSNLRSNKFYFSSDHILYSKIRPYLNKVAYPRFAGVCSADIYPLRPKNKNVTHWYLISLLRSQAFLDYSKMHSDRLRIPKLNKPQLGKFEFPLPDPDILIEFDERAEKIVSIENGFFARQEKVEKLYQGILYRAFSGDLTASWREAHMKELLQETELQTKALAS